MAPPVMDTKGVLAQWLGVCSLPFLIPGSSHTNLSLFFFFFAFSPVRFPFPLLDFPSSRPTAQSSTNKAAPLPQPLRSESVPASTSSGSSDHAGQLQIRPQASRQQQQLQFRPLSGSVVPTSSFTSDLRLRQHFQSAAQVQLPTSTSDTRTARVRPEPNLTPNLRYEEVSFKNTKPEATESNYRGDWIYSGV